MAPRSNADPVFSQTLMVDLTPATAYWRRVIIGVGRLCRERPSIRLWQETFDSAMIGDANCIDGVIAVVPAADPNDRSTRFGAPVVNVSSWTLPVPFPTVTIDNLAVGRLAADHLLGQGYLHFACHMSSEYYFSRKRAEGFVERLAEAGKTAALFDSSPDGIQQPAASLRRATIAWLRELPQPLGVFAHSDARAATLLELCREAELSVPEQVGLLGVDDDDMLLMTATPTLSSIDPAAEVIGYRAVELLLEILNGAPQPTEPILVPPHRVVQRQSTEPAFLDDPLLALAMAYIGDHATDPIRVEDVVTAAATSRRALERHFRQRLGRSPADEIRRVQIDHAKRLLLESEFKLSRIPKAVGYRNFRNFASAFGRATGMSPAKYASTYRVRPSDPAG